MSNIPVRKQGQTDKQFLKVLYNYMSQYHEFYMEKIRHRDSIIFELKNETELVSKLEHNIALAKIEELRAALKKYGLWTGQ